MVRGGMIPWCISGFEHSVRLSQVVDRGVQIVVLKRGKQIKCNSEEKLKVRGHASSHYLG